MIIGLYGKARSGKDTVADMLMTKLDNSMKLAFAKPIKDMLGVMSGMTHETMEKMKDKKLPHVGGHSLRYLMQELGTEWGRMQIHPMIWINLLQERMEMMAAIQNIEHFIITDVRFPNEAQWVLSKGGILIQVARPDQTPIDASEHSSETSCQRFEPHVTLLNDGSFADLAKQIDNLVPALGLLGDPIRHTGITTSSEGG